MSLPRPISPPYYNAVITRKKINPISLIVEYVDENSLNYCPTNPNESEGIGIIIMDEKIKFY
jgi:hypothetical protein